MNKYLKPPFAKPRFRLSLASALDCFAAAQDHALPPWTKLATTHVQNGLVFFSFTISEIPPVLLGIP